MDEGDIRDFGFDPRMASIVRTKERRGPGSVPSAVINHLYPLQGLLRHFLPMLTAVPCADYLWLVGGVPPGDPPAHGVHEREGGRPAQVAGVLMALGHFSPGAPSVGAMDNDKGARTPRPV